MGYTRQLRTDRLKGNDCLELPDVRDGLTRLERAILHELARAQRELAQRDVPSTLLYGRVVEHMNVGPREFQRALTRLARRRRP